MSENNETCPVPIIISEVQPARPRRKRSTIQPPNPNSISENFKMDVLTVPESADTNTTNLIPDPRYSGYDQSGQRLSISPQNVNTSLNIPSQSSPSVGTSPSESEPGGTTSCIYPQITILRPSSATLPSSPNRHIQSAHRRYSSITKPVIQDSDNSLGSGIGIYSRASPRRSSIAVIAPSGKFLSPGTRDLDSSHPPPSQHQRGRRISFGLGGVPKSGYWGVSGNLENDSDSDDSLLAPASRKTSKTFKVRGPTLMGYNRRQWHHLIVFAIVDFCSALVISIQGPNFPREAEQKQLSATEVGLCFGVFECTILIFCPIFGKALGKISPQSLFNAGVFTSGICVIMFGFLTDIDDPSTFLALSLFLRTVEGIGDAACLTSSYGIITMECPDTVSTTFIFLKTFFGIGFILGPVLGGILFTLGGFFLPFVVLGSLLFSSAIFTLFLLPKPISDLDSSSETIVLANNGQKENKGAIGFISLLKNPVVILSGFAIVSASVTIGFLNATLEPHIREFTSSALSVGVVFVLNGGAYSLSSPAWSLMGHMVSDPKYMTLMGASLTFTAFLLIGPAPFIPIDTHLWLTCTGLVILGIGNGATFVSGFLLALRDTVDKGYPDDESTYGLVSGLYTSLFAIGNCIGPTISGVLTDNFGFRDATIFVLALQTLLILFVIGFLIFDGISSRTNRRNSEFDDESYSALQVSESQDEWEDSNKDFKDDIPRTNYGAIISNSV